MIVILTLRIVHIHRAASSFLSWRLRLNHGVVCVFIKLRKRQEASRVHGPRHEKERQLHPVLRHYWNSPPQHEISRSEVPNQRPPRRKLSSQRRARLPHRTEEPHPAQSSRRGRSRSHGPLRFQAPRRLRQRPRLIV
ncbi:hypothetical protein Syun_015097 [Stephania yunnanensis]|uniref:Uncharacterized protein n=1 Tax=Stephania yunnanensis TaxID=152371 RepID=A0AAP0JMV0_9MAGN